MSETRTVKENRKSFTIIRENVGKLNLYIKQRISKDDLTEEEIISFRKEVSKK